MDGELRSLLDLYEARGNEDLYVRAKPRYEQAIAADPDSVVIRDYGYLLECHARPELARALEQYEHALALEPEADKVRYHRMSAQAALGHIDEEVRDYTAQVAAAPDDIRPYRYLARACLVARQYDKAGNAIDAGLALANQDRVLIECRGDLRAATGDPEAALADWRHALDLDPEDRRHRRTGNGYGTNWCARVPLAPVILSEPPTMSARHSHARSVGRPPKAGIAGSNPARGHHL
ncbi:MAG TPA: hypothetical protein VF506_22620 [Streptosporangiaceae bacterium]